MRATITHLLVDLEVDGPGEDTRPPVFVTGYAAAVEVGVAAEPWPEPTELPTAPTVQ